MAIRLSASRTRAWVGQRIGIVGQLIDAEGRGVAGTDVTLLATSGLLVARTASGAVQRGATVRLVTEPAGIVRFDLLPPLLPPLGREAESALEAELAQLGDGSDPAASVMPRLAAFAARYRRQAGAALREAVDRLFEQYRAELEPPALDWPFETATVLAVGEAGGEAGLSGAVTLLFRNWLPAFLPALEAAVRDDGRLAAAIGRIDPAAAPESTARGLLAASQAFAALEQGKLGRRARTKLAGEPVIRFLDRIGEDASPELVEKAFQVAGAAQGPIGAGGLTLFDAVENAQSVAESIGTRRTVKPEALDALRQDIADRTDRTLDRIHVKVRALEAESPSRGELANLESRIAERFSEQLGSQVRDLRSRLDSSIVQFRQEVDGKLRTKADQETVAGLNQSVVTLQIENRRVNRQIEGIDPRILRPGGGGGFGR